MVLCVPVSMHEPTAIAETSFSVTRRVLLDSLLASSAGGHIDSECVLDEFSRLTIRTAGCVLD